MTASTITLSGLKALADQLEADAIAVREIQLRAELGDISPEQAAAELSERGIAIV